MRVLINYGRDLESVRKLYQKGKDDPPVMRNMPPVAGKITWARQLYRKIDTPMRAFKRKPEVLRVSFISILSKNRYSTYLKALPLLVITQSNY